MIRQIFQQVCPPILWKAIASTKIGLSENKRWKSFFKQGYSNLKNTKPTNQDLDPYWQPEMAAMLETWGEGTVWNELEFLMVNTRGKVLDIACGTGKNIESLAKFPNINVHGCDISDFLIQKAAERGVSKERLRVCDATMTGYDDNSFDYAYSIGSLEHFTEEGIVKFIAEAYRTTKHSSFHMIPVSRSGKDDGWVKTSQSYYNNSSEWWLNKYKSCYQTVFVIDSSWQDEISTGKWFICVKKMEK